MVCCTTLWWDGAGKGRGWKTAAIIYCWQQQHVRGRTAQLSDISSGATCVADLDSAALALTKKASENSRVRQSTLVYIIIHLCAYIYVMDFLWTTVFKSQFASWILIFGHLWRNVNICVSTEENQRLQRLHDASVDSVLNMEGGFYSVVASADTRIMVLRDILQEERTQKTRLQEQVRHRERQTDRQRETET